MVESLSRFEDFYAADGRLTLVSGDPTPVSAGVSGIIYYTPYRGDRIALYNGSFWQPIRFTEKSLSLSGIVADTNYDVFGYLDTSGQLALELSVAWATSSTRTTALVRQDGILSKSGALTRRYLGTIRAYITSNTVDGGGIPQRFMWNCYNRVRSEAYSSISTGWSAAAGVWTEIGLFSSNHRYVVGVVEDAITAAICVSASNATVGSTFHLSLGLNSAVVANGATSDEILLTGGLGLVAKAHFNGLPGLGYNYLAGLYQTIAGPASAGGDADYNRMSSSFWR